MKRILKALSAFALSLVFTLALAVVPVRAAEIDLNGEVKGNYAGYLVILNEPGAAPYSVSPFAAATLMAAEDEREDLLVLAEDLRIYKAGALNEVRNLVYSGQVAVVEPDYVAELFDVVPVVPNDPRLTTGQSYLIGPNGVGVRSAWEAGLTGEGVTVAVIDSGMYRDHEDVPLKQARGRYYSYREDPEGRYELEIVEGVRKRYSYWSSSDWNDDSGHGSMVSGIIAANTNNGLGMASIAPGATIMPIRCFTSTPGHVGGLTSNLISGLQFAVTNGADIINMSWGIDSESASLKAAVDAAYQAGCILIAAAGNGGAGKKVEYPAGWDNVISVGATDYLGRLCTYSQRAESVNVCAPGGMGSGGDSIVSMGCSAPSSYLTKIGTSFSAPAVTAAAALLLQADPTMTQGDFLALLQQTSHKVLIDSSGAGNIQQYTGAGRLDIQALLDATGYAGCSAQRTEEGISVYAGYHPTKNSGIEEVVAVVAGYNAAGHLVESHSAQLEKSGYSNCADSFLFTSPDIAELRTYYLDPNALLSALAEPIIPLLEN